MSTEVSEISQMKTGHFFSNESFLRNLNKKLSLKK